MDLKKQGAFITSFLYYAAIAAICYILLKILLPMLAPFITAFVIAAVLNPPVSMMEERMGGRNKPAAIVLFLFYACIAGTAALFGSRLLFSAQEQAKKLPGFYSQVVEPGLVQFLAFTEKLFPVHGTVISALGQNLVYFMESAVGTMSSGALSWGASLLSSLPSVLLNLLIAVIASFFLTSDYRDTVSFVLRQFPEDKRALILAVYSSARKITLRLVKAYAFLMLITFAELLAGFTVLGVPMKWTAAGLITLVDILPVLGTGTVLLPWALIAWITGAESLGFGLACLYFLITVIRQALEPKILGLQMGLSPAAVLLCIFAGGKLLGLPGIFLFPIGAAVVKELNDEGMIRLIK